MTLEYGLALCVFTVIVVFCFSSFKVGGDADE
jgi:hypothetical protein